MLLLCLALYLVPYFDSNLVFGRFFFVLLNKCHPRAVNVERGSGSFNLFLYLTSVFVTIAVLAIGLSIRLVF